MNKYMPKRLCPKCNEPFGYYEYYDIENNKIYNYVCSCAYIEQGIIPFNIIEIDYCLMHKNSEWVKCDLCVYKEICEREPQEYASKECLPSLFKTLKNRIRNI